MTKQSTSQKEQFVTGCTDCPFLEQEIQICNISEEDLTQDIADIFESDNPTYPEKCPLIKTAYLIILKPKNTKRKKYK